MKPQSLTSLEIRAVSGLAAIIALRMLGLFLLLPVIAPYATELPGSTPALVGLAVGAYGLTQAVFQIPFGLWSDRYGRKRMITLGLLIFAFGSIIAALGDDIVTLIVGRIIQGGGAVSAVVAALAADLTREQHRNTIMAFIGISIGGVFMLSLVLGPPATQWIGVDGLFWLIAVLVGFALWVLWALVPTPARPSVHRDIETVPAQLLEILRDPHLVRLDLGIFVLHMILSALFVSLPLVLTDNHGMALEQHWRIYLPVLVLSILGLVPMLKLASRDQRVLQAKGIGITVLILAQGVLAFAIDNFWILFFGLWLFFVGFNALEAMLPSLVSRTAPAAKKGTALGVYNTFEFFGIFVGGVTGGALFGAYGMTGVAVFCGCCLAFWLSVVMRSPPPQLFHTRLVPVKLNSGDGDARLRERLLAIPGVLEAVLVPEEGVAYLKVDEAKLDETLLEEIVLS